MKETQDSRVLYSKDAEMLVIGCMITCMKSFRMGMRLLNEEDFYLTEHKVIFNAFLAVFSEEKVSDIHLLSEFLKRENNLDSVGGVAYLTMITQYAGTSTYIEEYIETLKEYTTKRRILNLVKDIKTQALKNTSPSLLIGFAQEELRGIDKKRSIKTKFNIQFIDQMESNLLMVDPPKKPMLLECLHDDEKRSSGFLPKGIVAMLVGAGGIGKTTLLAQLAISIASGSPFLSIFTTTKFCGEEKKGAVFLGLGENQHDDIHRILYKASRHLHHREQNLFENTLLETSKRIAPFSFCGQQAAFIEDRKTSQYFKELKVRLEDSAPQNGWTLLIFDPISRIMGADAEIDNATATHFIALMEELSLDLPGNPTVLLSHHVNKSAINQTIQQNQSAARGSSALTDGVRWQCNYSKAPEKLAEKDTTPQNIFILKMTKSNFTEIFKDIKTKKDKEGFIDLFIENQNPAFFS